MNSPNLNEINFEDILKLDKVSIKVAPEKKGLILKHVEYEIRSQRYKSLVQRRFKEFVALYDLLIIRFPFRLIPALPSKKFVGNGDIHFLEERRKALERFLNLVARHPVISSDALIYCFLTAKNDELQSKIKESFRNSLEEYNMNEANQSADLIEMDMAKYPLVKEQLKSLQQSLTRLSKSTSKTMELNQSSVIETLDFGKELNMLISQDDNLLSKSFNNQLNGETVFSKFISISEQINNDVLLQENRVVEPINSYLDLLSAYKDLCDRYENDLRKHSKETNSRKINKTEESLEDLERKSHFALHCILSETLLVKSYSATIPLVLKNLTALKINSHTEFAKIYGTIKYDKN